MLPLTRTGSLCCLRTSCKQSKSGDVVSRIDQWKKLILVGGDTSCSAGYILVLDGNSEMNVVIVYGSSFASVPVLIL
jgi:hypothetical protein